MSPGVAGPTAPKRGQRRVSPEVVDLSRPKWLLTVKGNDSFSLPDDDISRNLSARGQKLASITLEQFERRLEQKNLMGVNGWPSAASRFIDSGRFVFPHPKGLSSSINDLQGN